MLTENLLPDVRSDDVFQVALTCRLLEEFHTEIAFNTVTRAMLARQLLQTEPKVNRPQAGLGQNWVTKK